MIGICNRCGRLHELDTTAFLCGTFTNTYVVNPCLRCAQLEAENAALKAQIAKGLDHEHHPSCGHVWTMRHTACPECFAEMRKAEAATRRDCTAAINWAERADSELAALKGRVCDTCQHRFVGMAPAGRPHFTYCKRTIVPVPELATQTYVMCVVLGNTCGAWQAREQTP